MKQPVIQRSSFYSWASLGLLISLVFFTGLRPAFAHQGGTNIHTFNGLWAGIRHPFMGLDHLLLVVAAGLLAARKHGSIVWTFTSASLAGIGLALMGMVVPSAVAVAIALVGVGILLIQSHTIATSLMFGGAAIVHSPDDWPEYNQQYIEHPEQSLKNDPNPMCRAKVSR